MKKERIILILDSNRVFEIDANDTELKVKKSSFTTPMQPDTLITFQSDQLINILGTKLLREVYILDFECLDKQIRQSLKLTSIQGKWTLTNMIATYLNKDECKWEEEEYEDLLKEMTLCYLEMKKCDEKEWKRITEIELPINRILYEVQANGIYFNNNKISSMCKNLHKDLYDYKNKIQLELDYTGDDLISYLNKHRIKHHLHQYSSDTELKNFCKLHKLEPFWDAKVAERNLKCLLLLSATNCKDKCKPIFKGFASSTGRIFLRDPALQHLKKNFRILLKKRLTVEWRYEYIDFGQFEAGILAGITENTKLQKLYETGDIYDCLAQKVHCDRSVAKMYFYSFVYGGIVPKGAEAFFEEYNLKNAIEKFVNKALKKGFVDTPLGNKRIINNVDDKTWILNHYIQGLSSLVFKQALINVDTTFSEKVNLVLPLHDAALFEVHKDISTTSIIEQFKDAFIKWVPGTAPIVKKKDFFKK